jgi:hypothetical protein
MDVQGMGVVEADVGMGVDLEIKLTPAAGDRYEREGERGERSESLTFWRNGHDEPPDEAKRLPAKRFSRGERWPPRV